MTTLGVVSLETTLDDALSLGARGLRWAEANGCPALVSATTDAQALVLGKLQREDTLRGRSPARFDGVRRRFTTGTEAQLEGQVLYHALCLPRLNALYGDTSARTLLNRNLRALLRGYTAAGVPLRYFGTEVLALLGHPVALVGYDQVASGAVLIEIFVGLDAPCVARPALLREPPRGLAEVMKRELSGPELLERAARGVVERLSASTVDVELPEATIEPSSLPTTPAASVSVPLGVVEAAGARVTGDLLVSCAALREVEARAGAALDAGEPFTEALLEPLRGAPLDGARAPDLLRALSLARH